MPPAVRGLRAAFVFLTRLPVGGFPYSPADWRWANAYFPVVGAAVGGIAAVVWYGSSPLGSWPAAILAVTASVLVTGAFHEDGLADTADALGGGLDDGERVLAILKDSRIGTYGTTALILSLGLRISLIERLGPHAMPALVLSHALARTPSVAIKWRLPYVTPGERARSRDLEGGGGLQLIVAVATTLFIALPLAEGVLELALLFAAIAAVGLVLALYFRRRVGGYTGDFLGATEQVAEVAVLMVLVGLRGTVQG